MYKTLRNIVLAGVMSAVGSGCVVTPGAMTYGAHLTNPGNAHIANAHGFAVLGDQGYRLAKAKENNYGRGSRDYEYGYEEMMDYVKKLKKEEWYDVMTGSGPKHSLRILGDVIEEIENEKNRGRNREKHLKALKILRIEERKRLEKINNSKNKRIEEDIKG